jgi:hypothetical protein
MSFHTPRKHSGEDNLGFFPRQRRPRSDAGKYSLSAFKPKTPTSSPPREQPSAWVAWAHLFPAWMRHGADWLAGRLHSEEVSEQEQVMSGALSGTSGAVLGRRSNYRYDEDVEVSEREYEERPKWDSIEARMVEMGLS